LAHIDLVGLVAPDFLERLSVPTLHRGQFEKRLRIVHRGWTEHEAIGLNPERDWAEECIDRSECLPSQEWSAEPSQALKPKLVDSLKVNAELIRNGRKLDSNTTIHRANSAQRSEP